MQFIRAGLISLLLATPAAAQTQFVYTNNQSSPNTVTGFLVNPDGNLTQLSGSPFATGANGQNGAPFSLAVTTFNENNYLYAANGADGTISGFRINPATGNLQDVPGPPSATNGQPANYSLTISPDNRFLFVASDEAALIHVFRISPVTGALREVRGGPFKINTPSFGLKVSRNGGFLLVGGDPNGGVRVFQISDSGALSEVPRSPFPSSAAVGGLENDCAGDLVFASSSRFIDIYSLGADGSLTPIPGSPFSDGQQIFDLVLSPGGRFLFTTGGFSQTDSAFRASADGSLAPVAGSPFALPDFTSGIAITPGGEFLYTALFISGAVDGRRVGANGKLTPVPGTPFITGEHSIAGLLESVVTFPASSCSQR